MADEPKLTSEWTRKRTVRKIRRETLIKPRDAYFDLFLSGLQRRQIVNRTKKSPSAVRGAVDQALARRRLDAPKEYASLRVARLTRALRCADVSLKEGGLTAIGPFVKVARELNLFHGAHVGPTRLAPPAALADIAPIPPLALTHSPGSYRIILGRKKLREGAVKCLKSFARVNFCVARPRGQFREAVPAGADFPRESVAEESRLHWQTLSQAFVGANQARLRSNLDHAV